MYPTLQLTANPNPLQTTTFGQALKLHRKKARLTQDELARQVNYTREYVAMLENDKRKPDATVVAALFIPALGLTTNEACAHHLLQLAAAARCKTLSQSGIEIKHSTHSQPGDTPSRSPSISANLLDHSFDWYVQVDPDAALQLAEAMGPYWAMQGQYKQTRAWLRQILAHSTSPTVLRGQALMRAADFARQQSDLPEALHLIEQAEHVFAQKQDWLMLGRAMHLHGWCLYHTDNRAETKTQFEKVLAFAQQHNLIALQADSWVGLANCALQVANTPAEAAPALAQLEQAQVIYQATGQPQLVAHTQNQMGLLLARLGQFDEALTRQTRAYDTFRFAMARIPLAWTACALADLHFARNDLRASLHYAQEALVAFEETETKEGCANASRHAGRALLGLGELNKAAQMFAACAKTAQTIGKPSFLALGLAGLGAVLLAQGQVPKAVQWLAASENLMAQVPSFLSAAERSQHDAVITLARQQLSEAAFAQAWGLGLALSHAEVVVAIEEA